MSQPALSREQRLRRRLRRTIFSIPWLIVAFVVGVMIVNAVVADPFNAMIAILTVGLVGLVILAGLIVTGLGFWLALRRERAKT